MVLVFGILLPKRLAAKRGQKLAFRMSGLLEVFWIVFFAVYGSFKCDYKSSVTSFRIDPNAGGGGSQRGRDTENGRCRKQKGVIDLEENEIIQNLFEFDDMAVDEFATHRTDIHASVDG